MSKKNNKLIVSLKNNTRFYQKKIKILKIFKFKFKKKYKSKVKEY